MSVHGPLGPLHRMLTPSQLVDLIGTQGGVKEGMDAAGRKVFQNRTIRQTQGCFMVETPGCLACLGGPLTHQVCAQVPPLYSISNLDPSLCCPGVRYKSLLTDGKNSFKAVVLNLWIAIPSWVKRPFHRGCLGSSYISDIYVTMAVMRQQ